MSWQPVIGLEVHVQLDTPSKLFSTSANGFGGDPNTRVNEVDIGLPGTLPVINRDAVEMAIMLGLELGAEINRHSVFVRKNYYYPDLPKNYQISQLHNPIIGAGKLTIQVEGEEPKDVRIHHAHLEEDAGKSVHDRFSASTGIDFNRAGVPLIEVVSDPDMHSAEEAMAYMRTLHRMVTYLGICDGNMSRGSLRCDANVSVRPSPDAPLGKRVEMKNINSFRFVGRAIQLEIARQTELLERGDTVAQETRLYDEKADTTRAMRKKDDVEDYRYFPDPDLLPLTVDDEWFERIRNRMQIPLNQLVQQYMGEFGLAPATANQIVTAGPAWMRYFETARAECGNAQLAGNFLVGEVAGLLNRNNQELDDCPVTAEQIAQLLKRVADQSISNRAAKQILEALWADASREVDELIETLGLQQLSDTHELEALAKKVIAENPDQVAQYRDGKTKVLGFLVGQLMKLSQGKADPRLAGQILKKSL